MLSMSCRKLSISAVSTSESVGSSDELLLSSLLCLAALRPHLEMVFEQAEEGSEYVITRYRSRNCNLRTQLSRICKAAGVDMWVKPFQNLRSSAEIDLNREFPQHVVARWLGQLRERRPEALPKNNRRRFSAGSWRAPSSRRKRRSSRAKHSGEALRRSSTLPHRIAGSRQRNKKPLRQQGLCLLMRLSAR